MTPARPIRQAKMAAGDWVTKGFQWEAFQGCDLVLDCALMTRSSPSNSRRVLLEKWFVIIALIAAVGFSVAWFFIAQPQDLSDIAADEQGPSTDPPRDIKVALQNSLKRGYPVTLTETEINQWLGQTLSTKQGGILADSVSLDRLWVRLEDNRAELVMVRHIMGQPFTVSMYLKIGQVQGPKGVLTEVHLNGGPYLDALPYPAQGGRFGQLVVPQGFLLLVMPAYEQLVTLFHDEIHLGFEEMAQTKIEKGRIILNPRAEPENQNDLR